MKIGTHFLAYSLVAIALASLPTNAWAMSAYERNIGFGKCVDWCGRHNKTEASKAKCDGQCAIYWYQIVKMPTSPLRDQ